MRQSLYIFCILIIWSVAFNGLYINGSESNDTDQNIYDDDDDDLDNIDYPVNGNEESCQNSKDIEQQVADSDDFVGTNLFGDEGYEKKCFSREEVALLSARKEFESLLPKGLGNNLLSDDTVATLIQYFYGVRQIILKLSRGTVQINALKAFYDAVGGYLNSYLLPITKFSYYAGSLKLDTTEHVSILLRNCKTALNTYGSGWKMPITFTKQFEAGVEPLNITQYCGVHSEADPCSSLTLLDDSCENDEAMIVPLPKLDPEEYNFLTDVWLPFKRKRRYNLQSRLSAFVLTRYFVIVSKCYRYQNINQDAFNVRLRDWLEINIKPHLDDEILYPGLGAFLRIYKTLECVETDSTKIVYKKHIQVPRSCVLNKKPLKNTENNNSTNDTNDTDEDTQGSSKLSLWNKLFKKKDQSNSSTDDDDTTNENGDSMDDESEESLAAHHHRSKQRDLIMIILMIVLILLILFFLIAMIAKYMRDLCKTDDKPKADATDKNKKKDEPQSKKPSGKEPPRKKAGGFMFRKQKKARFARDEEKDLSNESSSIMSSNKNFNLKPSNECQAGYAFLSNTTPKFCIGEDETDRIQDQLDKCMSSSQGQNWQCTVCYRFLESYEPVYIRNSSSCKGQRICEKCYYEGKYVKEPELVPNLQSKYSHQKAFSLNVQNCQEANARLNLMQCKRNRKCCGCTEHITKDNPACCRESDKCSSCCGCCGKSAKPNGLKCLICAKSMEATDVKTPACFYQKRICSGCRKSDDKPIKNWNCVTCNKTIDNDDPIYFRDPHCPIENRKCSGCHGRERAKSSCVSCARLIKDSEIKCSKCRESEVFLRSPRIKSQPSNFLMKSKQHQATNFTSDVKKNIQADPSKNILQKSHATRDKNGSLKQVNWICVRCGQVINKSDPIFYTRPCCPKGKRTCFTCYNELKCKWICISCGRTIEANDPIYITNPKCAKDKRKCQACLKNTKNIWQPSVQTLKLAKRKGSKLLGYNRMCFRCGISSKQSTRRCGVSGKPNKVSSARLKIAKPFSISRKNHNHKTKSVHSSKNISVAICRSEVIQPKAQDIDYSFIRNLISENILPKDICKNLLNDDTVEALMQYFHGVNQIILKMTVGNAQYYAEKAFFDAFGGFLNHYLIPHIKLSYYAGVITLKTTLHVFDLFEQCKRFLNTNGNGWRPPINDFSDLIMEISPLSISDVQSGDKECEKSACGNLNLSDEGCENDEDMIVPLPKLDPEEMGKLSSIWLPFKRKHSFNLKSQLSAFVLIRYYVTVSRCYHYQHIDQDTFDRRFQEWIQENIEPHITDDTFYPGLGGILRIIKALKRTKKFTRSHTKTKPQHDVQQSVKLVPEKIKHRQIVPIRSHQSKSSSLKAKHKPNLFRQFFEKNNDDTDVEIDEKSPMLDDDSIKNKRKNYIIAAITIAIILLIFICIVAVVTKNMREMCKAKKRLKQRKEERKVKLNRATAGQVNYSRKVRYENIQENPYEELESTTIDSHKSGHSFEDASEVTAVIENNKNECKSDGTQYSHFKNKQVLSPIESDANICQTMDDELEVSTQKSCASKPMPPYSQNCDCDPKNKLGKRSQRNRTTCFNCLATKKGSNKEMVSLKPEAYKQSVKQFSKPKANASTKQNRRYSPFAGSQPEYTSPPKFSISKKEKSTLNDGKKENCETPKCFNKKCDELKIVLGQPPRRTSCIVKDAVPYYHSDSSMHRSTDRNCGPSQKAKSDVIMPTRTPPLNTKGATTFKRPQPINKNQCGPGASSSWETLDSKK